MRNIAVVCRKSGMMKDFVLQQVAIDIDNLHIFPRRIIVGQWTYWHVDQPKDLTGLAWHYYIVLGPIGRVQEETIAIMADHGVERMETWRNDYGNR